MTSKLFVLIPIISAFYVLSSIGQSQNNGYHLAIFNAINTYRGQHHVSNFQWDPELNQKAQNRSKICAKNKSNNFKTKLKIGENVYITWGSKPSPNTVVSTWYNESTGYDYTSNTVNPKAANFTTMVWKSANYIGVGSAANNGSFWCIVVDVKPNTNVAGKYKANVLAK